LYPNPVISAVGEEINGGPVIRYGEFGGTVEQRIVTAGKLRKSRATAEREQDQWEAAAEAERLQVLNAVRALYYEALGRQQVLGIREELAALSAEAVTTTEQLFNVGQADRPDLLAVTIEAKQAQVKVVAARNEQRRTWRELGAVLGMPALDVSPLDGALENPPLIEEAEQLRKILESSPEVEIARAGVERAEAYLARARAEKIPDIVARGGLRYNRELLELGGTPVGVEGVFDVGVRLPIFDRNQGEVAAARAEVELARREEQRVGLSLRARLAAAFQEYQNARVVAEAYGAEILPAAEEGRQLYEEAFQRMAAAYPQALVTRRDLFQLREEYVESLVQVWKRATEIQGMLLAGDGLGGPARPVSNGAGSPGAQSEDR
jgi:cobalt-zinc-cadmium efflux system outer membrane protein